MTEKNPIQIKNINYLLTKVETRYEKNEERNS